MAYSNANNFETLSENKMVLNPETTVIVKLDKVKSSGKLKLHIREYVTTPEYTGFSRNGVSLPIENVEDLNKLEGLLTDFISEAKKLV